MIVPEITRIAESEFLELNKKLGGIIDSKIYRTQGSNWKKVIVSRGFHSLQLDYDDLRVIYLSDAVKHLSQITGNQIQMNGEYFFSINCYID